jgi:hypothetical protein
VADRLEHRIRLLSASTGAVTDLAGLPGVAGYADGSKGSATFNAPYVNSLRRTALCSVCGVVLLIRPAPLHPPPGTACPTPPMACTWPLPTTRTTACAPSRCPPVTSPL